MTLAIYSSPVRKHQQATKSCELQRYSHGKSVSWLADDTRIRPTRESWSQADVDNWECRWPNDWGLIENCRSNRSARSFRFRETYGVDNVVLSDIVRPSDELLQQGLIDQRQRWVYLQEIFVGTYRYADVMDIKQVQELLVNNQIDWMIHLSALLSAVG